MARTFRLLKKIKTDDVIKIDVAQSWKIWDSTTIHKTCMFFNGKSVWTKSDKTSPRVVWVETDQGGFVIEDELDYEFVSNLTGLPLEKINEICKIQPCDTVQS